MTATTTAEYAVTIPGQAWELICDWQELDRPDYDHLMTRLDHFHVRRRGPVGRSITIHGLTRHDVELLARECIDRGEHELYMQAGPDGYAQYRAPARALVRAGQRMLDQLGQGC